MDGSGVTILDSIRTRVLRRLLKRSRRLRFACIPGDFISDEIIAEGLYERAVLEFLARAFFGQPSFSAGWALDVGANIGNHACFFAEYFESVVAFEPNPTAFQLLQFNVRLNAISNVTCVCAALGAQTGDGVLREDPGMNLGASTLAGHGTGQRVRVEIMRGDDFLADHPPVGALKFVKIDVEGLEGEVLLGLASTIEREMPLIWYETDYCAGTSPGQLLKELGYSNFATLPTTSRLSRSDVLGRARRFLNDRIQLVDVDPERLNASCHMVLAIPPGTQPSHVRGGSRPTTQ